MKAKELKKILNKFHGDTEVIVSTPDGDQEIDSVYGGECGFGPISDGEYVFIETKATTP